MFMFSSLIMNWYLIQDYGKLLGEIDTQIADKWLFVNVIPKITFTFNLGIFGLGLYTFFREVTKS